MVRGVNRSGQTQKHSPAKSAKKDNESRKMMVATGLANLAVRGKTHQAETSAISLKGRVTIGQSNKKVEHAFKKTFSVKK